MFACCRELFSLKKHCHFFEGTQEEAQAHFDKLLTGTEFDAKDQSDMIAELKRQLAEANNTIKQYQQVGAQRETMKGKPNSINALCVSFRPEWLLLALTPCLISSLLPVFCRLFSLFRITNLRH